jgi:hypothetical protein
MIKRKSYSKKAQEEMVGFALIIIIVAIVILVFLSFSLRNSTGENVESYEVESFIQTALQYTTECRTSLGYLDVQRLVLECSKERTCDSGKNSCELLKETVESLTNETWFVGEDRPVKGYDFLINSDSGEILSVKQGTVAGNYRGASYIFTRSGIDFETVFRTYY